MAEKIDTILLTPGIEEKIPPISAIIRIVIDKLVNTLTEGIEITDVKFQIRKYQIIVYKL